MHALQRQKSRESYPLPQVRVQPDGQRPRDVSGVRGAPGQDVIPVTGLTLPLIGHATWHAYRELVR